MIKSLIVSVRKWALLLIGLVVIASACSNSPFSSSNDEAQAELSAGPINPSPLSGRENGLNKPILILKIDNVKNSRPHEGLSAADQVYVERIEGGFSRLVSVFATELPRSVGPIRSARPTDISILRQFGAPAFGYSGAQSKLIPLLDAEPFVDISNRVTGDGWYRAGEPRFAPHNLMVDPNRLMELATAKSAVSTATYGFTFSKEFTPATRKTDSIKISYPASSTEFKWAKGQGWEVWFDDELATDSLTNLPLYASTVIVQITQTKSSGLKDSYGKDVPDQQLLGSGKAYLLRDGKSIELTWERLADNQFPTFRYQGEVMSLKAGQIWFAYASDSEVTLELAQSAQQ